MDLIADVAKMVAIYFVGLVLYHALRPRKKKPLPESERKIVDDLAQRELVEPRVRVYRNKPENNLGGGGG